MNLSNYVLNWEKITARLSMDAAGILNAIRTIWGAEGISKTTDNT